MQKLINDPFRAENPKTLFCKLFRYPWFPPGLTERPRWGRKRLSNQITIESRTERKMTLKGVGAFQRTTQMEEKHAFMSPLDQ
ncbi:MAG: hypothetical protein DWH73_01290 [Planctomycetota bacterium]|nr:MAG: hypothetical protein DWH73_01290 [Planctomycetota bacterium]